MKSWQGFAAKQGQACGRLLLLLVLFVVVSESAGQTDQLTVIALKHRTAVELIPLVKPLLRKGDFIAGENNKLLLRTNPETFTAVQMAVSELDRRAATLAISIREIGEDDLRGEKFSSQIAVARGEPDNGSDSGDGVTLSVSSQRFATAERARFNQQLRVIEGGEALFFTENHRPSVAFQQTLIGTTELVTKTRDETSGLIVSAVRRGEKSARVDIRQQSARFSGREDISRQFLGTTLMVNLDEWTTIAGFGESGENGSTSAERRGSMGTLRDRRYQIKVEVADDR